MHTAEKRTPLDGRHRRKAPFRESLRALAWRPRTAFRLWLPPQSSHASPSGCSELTCPLPPPRQVQDKLLLSACHLLVSLATTVRPVFLISIPAVQKLFNRITDASAQRLVDKVRPRGHLVGTGAGARPWGSCGEESGLAFCAQHLMAMPMWTAFLRPGAEQPLCPPVMPSDGAGGVLVHTGAVFLVTHSGRAAGRAGSVAATARGLLGGSGWKLRNNPDGWRGSRQFFPSPWLLSWRQGTLMGSDCPTSTLLSSSEGVRSQLWRPVRGRVRRVPLLGQALD